MNTPNRDRDDTVNLLMSWLFVLNMGILFAAFFSIAIWTQGVPWRLSALTSFVVGTLVVFCFPLAWFCATRTSANWLAYLTAATVAIAGAISWLVDGSMLADRLWPYTHRTQAVVAGLIGTVAYLVLLTFFFGWSDGNRRQFPSVATALLALLGAGVICGLVASAMLMGGTWLWPSRSVHSLVGWYAWVSKGVAGGLIGIGGIGMSALSWLDGLWPRSICCLGSVAWLATLLGATQGITGMSAWAHLLHGFAGALVVIWLLLVGREASRRRREGLDAIRN